MNIDDTYVQPGDLVIGNRDPLKAVFAADGRRLTNGVTMAGSEKELENIKQQSLNHALKTGGTHTKPNFISTQTKNKKIKKNNSQKNIQVPIDVYEDFEPIEVPLVKNRVELVIFENSFGRMRVQVQNILEHDLAFLLIFSDASQVIFEPKVGESLTFTRAGEKFNVYYPGVIFDWTTGDEKAMILFKIPDENNDD